MNRNQLIQQLGTAPQWDICIIGGGATGLGIAVDAASRGLKTILLEQHDFAKGTSSKSTKLVHGGVRYLQQGNIRLVMEALKERGLLINNAPHLVHNQQFVVPHYKWWEGSFYGIGLKIYDWMAGSLGLGPSEFISAKEVVALIPTIDTKDLKGGIVYHDGQFDDTRLAISLAQTAVQYNAVVLNYCPVTALLKTDATVTGVQMQDIFSGITYNLQSKTVINATGVFTDTILNMDDPGHESMIAPSQGIHLVVDRSFLPGDTAVMIPKTDDGRVLFAVPWHDKVVLGTTDTPVDTALLEPVPQEQEIDFILQHIGRYLTKDPQRSDVKSMFAGLRPLVKGKAKKTAALSRDHLISTSASGLLTITGGKWTTYRKMAEDAVDIAIANSQLTASSCITKTLKLYGHDQPVIPPMAVTKAAIEKAINEEMCMTVEDYLARRTRHLLLDAASAIAAAPDVAKYMAASLHKNEEWIADQLHSFTNVAKKYLPSTFNQ